MTEATDTVAGSGLAAERARRQAQVDERRRAGREPYPYRFDRTHTVAEVRAGWPDLEPGTETSDAVTVAGRVLLKRDTGKLVFATIAERGAEVQLFISKSVVGDEGFADVKELDRGDWVGVHGTVMTTRAGELSIRVDRLELLAKSLRPLPDKWHGLSDPDTRFRQRYVDLVVNSEARRAFDVRHAVIASFRRTFAERGYVEVETPVLHVDAGGAHARPFVTHYNVLDMPLYLRIALELHLKRLIVGGMDRVFEIGRVFRNEGLSSRHNTEFTMMESYEAYADVGDVMALTEELIVRAARDALGTTVVQIRGQEVDLAAGIPKRRMVDLVGEAIGEEVHPSQPVDARPRPGRAVRRAMAAAMGFRQVDRGAVRSDRRAGHRRPGLHHRASGGDLPTGQGRPSRPVPHRALRAVRRLPRAGQRLQRAQRPRRAAPALRGGAASP